jgi:hypothetical protein
MIIKVLLFIIVLIFVYETYQTFAKMQEEYFITAQIHNKDNMSREKFVSLSGDAEKDDIAKTIAINCKEFTKKQNRIMPVKPILADELDTPEYASFKPLEYNPNRLYYWRRDILIPEGYRRSQDDDKEIAKVQALFDAETDQDKKQILQDELDLFKWKNNVLELKDKKTGEDRSMRDITTDYFPNELGMTRTWLEPHSHIPDYSEALNYGYKVYQKDNTKDYQKENKNADVSWTKNEDKYIYSRTGLIL